MKIISFRMRDIMQTIPGDRRVWEAQIQTVSVIVTRQAIYMQFMFRRLPQPERPSTKRSC